MVQWTALRLKQSEHNSDWKLLTNITKRPRQDSRKKNSLSARKCTTFVVFSSLPRNLQFNVTAKNNKYAVALKIGLDLSRMYELRGYVEIIVLRICFRISIFDIRRAKKHKSPHQFFPYILYRSLLLQKNKYDDAKQEKHVDQCKRLDAFVGGHSFCKVSNQRHRVI